MAEETDVARCAQCGGMVLDPMSTLCAMCIATNGICPSCRRPMVNIDGKGPKCVPCEVTHAKVSPAKRNVAQIWQCGRCGLEQVRPNVRGSTVCAKCGTDEHMRCIGEQVIKCPRCGGAMDEEGLCATPDCEPVRGDPDCAEEASRTPVLSNGILHQLYEAGVIDSLDQRVIVDFASDKPVKIYTQRLVSRAFLDVLMGKPILVALAKAENVGDESCRNTEKATA